MSSALKSLSPVGISENKEINEILSKSKMKNYDPDGFRYTNIWELIELINSPQ